jgi:hypothetical protein
MYRGLMILAVGALITGLVWSTAARADTTIYPANYSFEDDDASVPNQPAGQGDGWLEGDMYPKSWTFYEPGGPGSLMLDIDTNGAWFPTINGGTGNQVLGMFDNHVSPQITQVLPDTVKAGCSYQLLVDYAFGSSYGGTSTITLSANGPLTLPVDDGNGGIAYSQGPGTLIASRVINSSEVIGGFDWGNNVATRDFSTFSTAVVLPGSSLIGQPLTVSINVDGGGLPGGGSDGAGTDATWFIDNVRIVEIAPPFPGDANGDGVVNINDLSVVLANYDKSGMLWAQGDFNGDGKVDISDLSNILANYDKTAGASGGIKAVPEPGTLALLAASLAGLLAYAWRKSN